MSVLAKLRALSWAERGLLCQAFIWLSVMRAAIALIPFRRIVAWQHLVVGESPHELDQDLAAKAERIGWAVRAIAARTLWDSTCLAQALAGSILLRQQKIHGTLYLGVAKNANKPQKMEAHAWLRCGEVILTGDAGHERFTVVSTFKT